jgi:ABC-type multidrug transport system fused ATPase/permease subunit
MLSIKSILKFLGSRVIFWLFVSLIASIILVLTDYGIANLLAIFLKILGFVKLDDGMSSWWFNNFHLTGWKFLIVLMGVIVLRSLAQFWVFHCADLIHELINTRLRLFSLYEILKYSSQKFISAAETNVKIGEIFPKASLFFLYGIPVLSYAIQIFILLGLITYTAWKEAILGYIGIVLMGIILLKINKRVRAVAKGIPEKQKALTIGIERVARNWLLVKVLRTNQKEYEELVGQTLGYYNHFIKAKFLGNLGAIIPNFLGSFLLIAIIFAQLIFWQNNGVNLIQFIYLFLRFLMDFGRLSKGFGLINSVFPQFQASVLYISKFKKNELQESLLPLQKLSIIGTANRINQQIIRKAEIPQIQKKSSYQDPPPTIEVKKVFFTYSPNSPLVLSNISLTIQSGEHLGIIGRSGAGKSTLLGLILGILNPIDGTITLDGIEAREFFARFSRSIGYVGSEPFLIEGTIKDNLNYGSEKCYSEQEYYQALEAARLLDVVENLPNRLNYWITENGEGLSAGQKQRLSLARALLRKPKILVLDEVSANLDEKTESKIALCYYSNS